MGWGPEHLIIFRSDLYRLFYPVRENNEVLSIGKLRDHVQQAKKITCLTLKDIIFFEIQSLLKEPLAGSVRDQIQAIVATVTDICTKLSLQRSWLTVMSRSVLPEFFNSDSNIMEAHNWDIKDLDDDEKRLDG
jgi:hypothetical protein